MEVEAIKIIAIEAIMKIDDQFDYFGAIDDRSLSAIPNLKPC